MNGFLLKRYDKWILERPLLALLFVFLLVVGIGSFAKDFRLDASADSLVLEDDKDLRYYREVRGRYGSDDFLVISYTPVAALFSPETLADLRRLRARLLELPRVASVTSILDVPLIDSPRVTLRELNREIRTLEISGMDIQEARREFLTSPLYRNLLVNPDGTTTALLVHLRRDETYHALLSRRTALRDQKRAGTLAKADRRELETVSEAFSRYSIEAMDRQRDDIAQVRAVMDRHRGTAHLHLGGVPMIVSDMIDFIRHDLAAFGIGVLVFLVAMLATIFRKPRWVILPLLCCFATVLFMFGFLGLVDWRVTVVSCNFTSLLLIITLSLTVHLVVRYHELHEEQPGADQRTLVLETVRTKVLPSFYTMLTTIVAFASLLVSNIRPVIDFGWMMAIGICAAFVIAFLLLPAGLVLFEPNIYRPRRNLSGVLIRGFLYLVERKGNLTLVLFVIVAVISGLGMARLTVENRFIDHFKTSTEIYQGMELIDRELGGTTPLDVIVDAPADFLTARAQAMAVDAPSHDPWETDDPWDDGAGEAGLSGTSYWYNAYRLDRVKAVHDYLDRLPESGKVLSMATTMRLMEHLYNDKPLDNFMLAVIHKKLPPRIEDTLFSPYMAPDGNQLRFYLRIVESDPSLQRNALLGKIRQGLVTDLGLEASQVRLSGMFVLYNNVLQSLYRSQILTIGVVFLLIMVMFVILFRSLRLAVIAIFPNLMAAGMVLGLMGWLDIPLDIMTITIAAITIGIAVDDTIHYVHRYRLEIEKDGDRLAAVRRSHCSVGRAMYYTSITVIMGFSILALSNFIPTIYFGLFTGLAMAVAMVANLTLLALLLIRFGATQSTG